jgi:hypothetical protein
VGAAALAAVVADPPVNGACSGVLHDCIFGPSVLHRINDAPVAVAFPC